jgi:hypothetical protein
MGIVVLEKRALSRKHPITYMRVHDRNRDNLVGRVVDLTAEGMRIVSEQPVTSVDSLQLRMTLPVGLGAAEVAFDARPVWSGPDINPDFFDTGLKLTAISDEGIRSLERVMRLSSFRG